METKDVSAVMPKSKKDARKTRYMNFVAKGKDVIDEDSTKSLRRMLEEMNRTPMFRTSSPPQGRT